MLEHTTPDKACITAQSTVGWRKRQQGQVAKKQYIDLVGAQKHWGQEKLIEHESNKSRLHEPVSIRPSLLRSALYKVSRPDPDKDKPELCEPAECRPISGGLHVAVWKIQKESVTYNLDLGGKLRQRLLVLTQQRRQQPLSNQIAVPGMQAVKVIRKLGLNPCIFSAQAVQCAK